MKNFKLIVGAGCVLAAALACYSLPSHAQTRLWGTYYGGIGTDRANAVVNTGAGFIYVAGMTQTAHGIATPNAFDGVKAKVGASSGYISKFDTNGKLVWGTYYGNDSPQAELLDIALDSAGNVYVLGTVNCPSQGLATFGAFQSQCQGGADMYLAKFNPSGERIWGTYFGGNGVEAALALSVTPDGVYVAGYTSSSQGIASPLSPDFSLGGSIDGVIAKFDLSGARKWSRYFGGEGAESVNDIACKGVSAASSTETCFVTGSTSSQTGILTVGAHDTTLDAPEDAFVARINGANGYKTWSTYYGGDFIDSGHSIAVDRNLNVYVGGNTLSKDEIATPNAFKTMPGGQSDMFLVKFDAGGIRQAGTYFGEGDAAESADTDSVVSMALDMSGNVYVLSYARLFESGFGSQATPNAFDQILSGSDDAVITKFNASLGRVWSTYYGGDEHETPGAIAVGRDNHIYAVGGTGSIDSMATPGSHKTTNDPSDAFIVEFVQ